MNNHEYLRATEAFFFYGLAISIFTPILGPYLKSVGITDSSLGLIYAIMPLVIFFVSPVSGRISDKIGRSRIIMGLFFLEIIGLLLYVFFTHPLAIIIARVFDALAISIIATLTLAKIEDNATDKNRGKLTGISISISMVGKVVGPLIGGFVADFFFIQAPFIVAMLFFILAMFCIRDGHPRKNRKFDWQDFFVFSEIKRFLSLKKLKGMGILGMVMHASTPAVMLFIPLLITEDFGLSFKYVGYATFLLYFMHMFEFYFGKLSDSKPYKLVFIGCIISGIGFTLLYFSSGLIDLIFILLVIGIGGSMWDIAAWTLMSRIGEKEKIEGEVLGTYISIAKIGSFFSFIISGFLVELLGIKPLFLVIGGVILVGSFVAYPLIKD